MFCTDVAENQHVVYLAKGFCPNENEQENRYSLGCYPIDKDIKWLYHACPYAEDSAKERKICNPCNQHQLCFLRACGHHTVEPHPCVHKTPLLKSPCRYVAHLTPYY